MGNLCFSAKRTERTLNHSPDEQVQPKRNKSSDRGRGRKEEAPMVRLFMTGLGSAGKTTIVRQLHLLCNRNGNYKLCDEDWQELSGGSKTGPNAQMEERAWARQIRKNLLETFDLLVKYIHQRGANFDSEANRQFAEKIEEFCEEMDWEWLEAELEQFREGLLALFRDEAIRQALRHRNKIEVDARKPFDGCDFFLSEQKIHEIFSSQFLATDEAKVHSRNPTAEMNTYRFKLNETRIEVTDVGGQRSELVKIVDYLRHWSFNWAERSHNFILLVVSMSDYNVGHRQHPGTLLDESVEYLKVLMNNKIAQNCGLLIFFNKKDRFRQKLLDEECKQDIAFLGPFLSPKQVRDYLAKGKFDERQMGDAVASKFVEAIKGMQGRQKDTYCRFTCAIDSKMMEGIFGAVKDQILEENMLDALP